MNTETKDGAKKILVVEDEKPYLRALVLKLERAGFSVSGAENGLEAIPIFESNKIDLALIDLVMPKMNGFEILEELSKKKISVPIFVLSNLAQDEDKEKIKKYNVLHFFEKATTPIVDIVDQVQKTLKK